MMMDLDLGAWVVALASFVLTFFIARSVRQRLNARSDSAKAKAAQEHLAVQSRQVRRARQRKKSG
jgi:hypothetical protein